MDKEQARFVLSGYRPDGADSLDEDFAEALRQANEDPELGSWLAESRAFDAGFAGALERLSIPPTLRQSILGRFAEVRQGLGPVEDPWDDAFARTLAGVRPPEVLRSQILAGMAAARRKRGRERRWRHVWLPLAAAAGITAALLVNFGAGKTGAGFLAQQRKLPVEVVQAEFIRAFEGPAFSFEEKNSEPHALFAHLQEKSLPCPCLLPKGMAAAKGIGCRELKIEGRTGSIICFHQTDDCTLHLLVIRRLDVDGELPGQAEPEIHRQGKWSVARWADEERVFVLIADEMEPERLRKLF